MKDPVKKTEALDFVFQKNTLNDQSNQIRDIRNKRGNDRRGKRGKVR